MKKTLFKVFAIVVSLVVIAGVYLLVDSLMVKNNMGDYLITETPTIRDYNGHTQSNYENSSTVESLTEWSLKVGIMGMKLDHDDEDDEAIHKKIRGIQNELMSDEYYCLVERDTEILIFPSMVTIKDEKLKPYAAEFKLDKIKVDGYELTEIHGNYEYLENEITFEEGKTGTLELEMTRFYPKGILLKNGDGHVINILADKHSQESCHMFYHENISEYQLLKTDYLDWWIFERDGGYSFVSFQNNANSQYDLFISEGFPTEITHEGIVYDGYKSLWNDDLKAFKEVLDQMGDLSQLDTKLVGWTGHLSDGSDPVVYLRTMD